MNIIEENPNSESPASHSVPISHYLIFILNVALGLGADLATKYWCFRQLGMPGEYIGSSTGTWKDSVYWLIDDVVGIQTALNEGALFGMGQGQNLFFLISSGTALVLLAAWLFIFKAAQSRLLTVIAAMMTAGILGNLYDRLGLANLIWNYPGPLHEVGQPVYAVRDWILVMIGSWPWPNFNIADSLMVCAAALLIGFVLFTKEQ